MPVYLPSAVVGNEHTLITLGNSAEIMGWFYPAKDHAQHIYQCMPCVYIGPPQQGNLYWTWGGEWERRQAYQEATNICATTIRSVSLGLQIEFTDVVPEEGAVLVRQIAVRNLSKQSCSLGLFHFGDWNMDGLRTGNALRFDHAAGVLLQSHRNVAVAIGGDALETWQCGKAGVNWHNNALQDLQDGALAHHDLEIGDVNWAFGFTRHLQPEETIRRTVVFALGDGANTALESWHTAMRHDAAEHCAARQAADSAWLSPGLRTLERALNASDEEKGERKKEKGESDISQISNLNSQVLPSELVQAYRRSLLCLPLLCGPEGVPVAAPEFDPEFEACGGYGYFWPRDGAEYLSGLMDAGYPQYADRLFDWCARHQDPAGFWHQRYFLNGEPGPNWCLPPDMLQIDQVGAVLWAYGKWLAQGGAAESVERGEDQAPGSRCEAVSDAHREMIRKAADYLLSRLTPRGVHANAFDTWETFIGSFTYSNASLYAAFKTAACVLDAPQYTESAQRVKHGVLEHFVRDGSLRRGLNQWGEPDRTVDSSALGAIEPFGLLDLSDEHDLQIAEGTLHAVFERLEVEFEGGRAVRRFEGDAYVGGVPACVNTLWAARCCCAVATRLNQIDRHDDAAQLIDRARLYLTTVLRRATPTGLLPELMQGPAGQRYWAAPHGWAMASFVSGILMLSKLLASRY